MKKILSKKTVGTDQSDGAIRRAAYTNELGEPDLILPADEAGGIEVLAFGRDFSPADEKEDGFVLLTNGMSDRRMAVPADIGGDVKARAELMWYVRKPDDNLVANLRWLAAYPFIDNTWLGFGHRIPMPWSPVTGTDFRTFLFLTPIIKPDQRVAETLTVGGDGVAILTVHLISGTEYESIKTDGLDPFLDMLDEQDYPIIFDPGRRSYL